MTQNGKRKNTDQDLAILSIQKDIEFILHEITDIKENHLHAINEEIKGLTVKLEAQKEELDKQREETLKRPTWLITLGLTIFGSIFVGMAVYLLTEIR